MIVRPVRSSDLPALIELARSTGTGLTTLPANEERLAHRVGWAEKTFRGEAERGDADYLFVLEDDDGRVVGISAIAGAVGLREPWYNFRVGLTVSASQELKIYREIPTLFLANDLTGNSELCSLFLHADYRSGLNGRMLAKARMLFIAEFRSCSAIRSSPRCAACPTTPGARRSGKAWADTSSRWNSARPTTSPAWATRPSSPN